MNDNVFDDNSKVLFTCPLDDSPKSGEWLDSEAMIFDATDEEQAAGEFLGKAIDIEDDWDNGTKWGSVENPTMTVGDF